MQKRSGTAKNIERRVRIISGALFWGNRQRRNATWIAADVLRAGVGGAKILRARALRSVATELAALIRRRMYMCTVLLLPIQSILLLISYFKYSTKKNNATISLNRYSNAYWCAFLLRIFIWEQHHVVHDTISQFHDLLSSNARASMPKSHSEIIPVEWIISVPRSS